MNNNLIKNNIYSNFITEKHIPIKEAFDKEELSYYIKIGDELGLFDFFPDYRENLMNYYISNGDLRYKEILDNIKFKFELWLKLKKLSANQLKGLIKHNQNNRDEFILGEYEISQNRKIKIKMDLKCHTFDCGKTESGKSNNLQRMKKWALKKNEIVFSFIIKEYEAIQIIKEFPNKVIPVDSDKNLKINFKTPSDKISQKRANEILAYDMKKTLNFQIGVFNLLIEFSNKYTEINGINFRFEEFYYYCKKNPPKFISNNDRERYASLIYRLEGLLNIFQNVFDTDESIDIEKIIKDKLSVFFYLVEVDEEYLTFLLTFLIHRIWIIQKLIRETPIHLFIDEAFVFVPVGIDKLITNASENFQPHISFQHKLITQARSSMIYIHTASQNPKFISQNFWDQAKVINLYNLTDDNIKYITNISLTDDEIRYFKEKMKTGFILHKHDFVPYWVPVQTYKYGEEK